MWSIIKSAARDLVGVVREWVLGVGRWPLAVGGFARSEGIINMYLSDTNNKNTWCLAG